MIHFHEVQKSVGEQRILSDLTLFLPKASYTLLSGEEQSGKTTLMRMITVSYTHLTLPTIYSV